MAEHPERHTKPKSRSMALGHGFDEEMVKRGKELVNQFHILMRTGQIHDPSNVAVDTAVDNVVKTLRDLGRWKDEVYLRLQGDSLFLDELKLKMDIDGFLSLTSILDVFRQLQIGGVIFKHTVKPLEIKKFVYILVQTDPSTSTPYNRLLEKMKASGISEIEIEELEEKKDQLAEILTDAKEVAKGTYFRTLTAVTEVMENVKLGQAVSVKRAKRVVQSMVDLLLQEESTLLGLSTLRSHDEYTHHHSVNVCILALAMGQRLGYPKKKLTELGVAALFHDMGKAKIPPEILNKPVDFTEEEWQVMRTHPVLGVKFVIKLKGINEMTIRMVTGIFEHHLNFDQSGYPKLENKWDLSLFGRIIGIVDCYDALTSSRVYNRVPYTPEKALKFMINKSGKAFDPSLLKIFINGIGIFPVGTLVLLDTNEFGVVVQANPHPDRPDRPRVKVIAGPDGEETDGPLRDLSELDGSTGHYRFTIERVLNPKDYNLDVSRYFL